LVQLQVLPSHDFGIDSAHELRSGSRYQEIPEGFAFQQLAELSSEIFRLIAAEEETSIEAVDNLGDAAGIGSHDRASKRRRLQKDLSEALSPRRENADFGSPVERRHLLGEQIVAIRRTQTHDIRDSPRLPLKAAPIAAAPAASYCEYQAVDPSASF